MSQTPEDSSPTPYKSFQDIFKKPSPPPDTQTPPPQDPPDPDPTPHNPIQDYPAPSTDPPRTTPDTVPDMDTQEWQDALARAKAKIAALATPSPPPVAPEPPRLATPATPPQAPIDHASLSWTEYHDPRDKKKKPTSYHLPAFLSPEDANKLIQACHDKSPRHGLFARFLWVTGVRSSEALFMTPKDLRPDTQTVLIRWQKQRIWKERFIKVEPLTFKELLTWGATMRPAERYFPWSKSNAATWMAAIEKDLGFKLTRYGCHVLRHSFTSFHYNLGTPPSVIQYMLGHASLKTTAIYSHLATNINEALLSPAYAIYAQSNTGLTHFAK